MLKEGRARGRQRNATPNPTINNTQNSDTEPNRAHRPRTRAWVKQQANLKANAEKNVEHKHHSPHHPATRAWTKQRGEDKSQEPPINPNSRLSAKPNISTRGLPAANSDRKKRQQTQSRQEIAPESTQQVSQRTKTGKEKAQRINNKTSAREATRSKQPSRTRQTETVLNQDLIAEEQSETLQNPQLAGWLRRVESVSPESTARARALYTAPLPGFPPGEEDNMNESLNSVNTRENPSTVKEKSPRGSKISANKLRVRRIEQRVTKDERLEHLRSIIETTLPDLPMKEATDLLSAAQTFIEGFSIYPNANCYPYVDNFSFEFDKAKSKINYPVINERYFNSDLERCLASNEAVLQRTIMIHLINQYWLGEIFDWNTEGQWSQPEDNRLPSSMDDIISQPKPDLAMFFTQESFTEEYFDDPIPSELMQCISPDGEGRCFPFLFMEVKKATADLQEAYLANLHSASQALHNIYTWMVRVGQEEKFFTDVRVFSLVFNAQDLSVRVHRAAKRQGDGAVIFRFDELLPSQRYTKDQACLLIRTTVTEYAAKELHTILKTTFKEVINQETQRVSAVLAGKRKVNPQGNPSTKRSKRQNSMTQTGQSFAMSALSTC